MVPAVSNKYCLLRLFSFSLNKMLISNTSKFPFYCLLVITYDYFSFNYENRIFFKILLIILYIYCICPIYNNNLHGEFYSNYKKVYFQDV